MKRTKKLKLNIATSLLYQLVSLVCGFVMPRFFLQYYGSAVNGLVSSITQFLAVISLCECGVGAVVQASLYRPIAEKDYSSISKIYKSSARFHNKIAIILVVYMVCLIFLFPAIIVNEFSFLYTALLIIVMTISLLARYYIGMTYRLILNAAQLSFIQMIVGASCLVLNTIGSILLIMHGASIHIVKLLTATLFLGQPIIYRMVVRKKFKINTKIQIDGEPIEQKWNGFAQHLATVVLENTDVMILTVFCTLESVSIYGIYHLVTSGIRLVFVAVFNNIKSFLGDMYAKREYILLNKSFEYIECLTHIVVVFTYTIAAILIVPFVRVYTWGVNDANYIQPLFGVMMCLTMAVYTMRLPYSQLVSAAGHFKQTQTSAVIEMLLNIVISIMVVSRYGIVGVTIGTLIAVSYRTIYFVFYLSKNILKRDCKMFLKQIIMDIFICIVIVLTTRHIRVEVQSYLMWVQMALKISLIGVWDVVVISILFNKNKIINIFRYILQKKE